MINGLGTPAEIKDAQAKIAKHNVTVKYNGANLMNANEVEALVKDTVAQLGSVDILVNNAGPSCSLLRPPLTPRRYPARCTCWYRILRLYLCMHIADAL